MTTTKNLGAVNKLKTIIITAANEDFAPLLLDLMQSLHQWDSTLSSAIGLLDLGLSDETLYKVQKHVNHIISPGWDIPLDAALQDQKPYLRAMTARPFLPQYFPGYDIYLWLDADTWVQEKYAIEIFFKAAKDGSMGIVPELHQSYVNDIPLYNWRASRLSSYFGVKTAAYLATHSYFNSGAFSLLKDSVHWETWARYLKKGVAQASNNISGQMTLEISDQTALNYAIWSDNLPVHPLPALCNWCCHLATPSININTKKLCEPHLPNMPIGLIHMTGATKDTVIKFQSNGMTIERNLRFNGDFVP